jgi:hypothetical protein
MYAYALSARCSAGAGTDAHADGPHRPGQGLASALQRHMLYLGGDQPLAGVGVAPLAAFVRVEHRGSKWTLKLNSRIIPG